MNNGPSFSIGEVEALVLKAYRGAGFSWGMAQEAGKAAGWLAGHRLPALDAFATLLGQTAGQPHDQLAPVITSDLWPAVWTGSSNQLCPVVTGTLLSDLGSTVLEGQTSATFLSVATPLILVPFVAALGVPAVLRVSSVEVFICGNTIEPFSVSETLVGKIDVTLVLVARHAQPGNSKPGSTRHDRFTPAVRGVGDVESVDLLETLAHQTYVPATQASRESGAGAGLTDDD